MLLVFHDASVAFITDLELCEVGFYNYKIYKKLVEGYKKTMVGHSAT
jgi:hypothetical protein